MTRRSPERADPAPRGSRFSGAGTLVAIDLVLLGGVCYPLWRDAAVAVLGLLLVAVVGSQLLGRIAWRAALDRFLKARPHRLRLAVAASAVLAVVGGLELVAQALTRSGLVRHRPAMATMLPAGAEDWRLAHITADPYREPDPELLWQPVARRPYNRQRFKGPPMAVPKPPGTYRVLCYGDSNTDGPSAGSWPELLQERLARRAGGRSFEVVNAGVTGYSSYQGVARFRRDVATYRPDLVLVSFGWNDAAPALGAPDREFRPPPPPVAALQRVLLRYRWYLLARGALPSRHRPASGPRVAVADYVDNLSSFADTAAAHGARVVLLTRPHRLPASELEALSEDPAAPAAARDGTWRAAVPSYNRALLAFSATRGVPAVDVQEAFAAHPERMADESHFDAEGRELMAATLERALEQVGLL